MTDSEKDAWKTFTDQVEIAGHRLIDTVSGLVAEGNVRTLRIRTGEGHTFMEIPLTAGAVAGGIVVLTAPWLAAIGAIAGIASKVHLEVVRDATAPTDTAEPTEAASLTPPPTGAV
jgi:predicted dinucleotide-binding enzyme